MSEEVLRYGGMRRFRLDRREDPTGVSGTGCVAQGVVFSDGTVAMRWMTKHRSTAFYSCVADLEVIHLHHGATVIRWQDPICFCCAAMLEDFEKLDRHCYACGAGQGRDTTQPLYNETRPDPSLGSWGPAITITKDDVIAHEPEPKP